MDYLIIVPVEFYPVEDGGAACESAFVDHLRILATRVGEHADRLHLVVPRMSDVAYEQRKSYLKVVDEARDGIRVSCIFPADTGRIEYLWKQAVPVYRQLVPLVKNAAVVHSGPSNDVFRPFEILSILLAKRFGRPSVFVVDIDERDSARMAYRTGKLSRKSLLLDKFLYSPFMDWQMKFAVRNCNLLMLKGQAMVDDYGRGAAHVKNFLDTAHPADAVIDDAKLETKVARKRGPGPLRLVYFGRLTEYKGILDMIRAAAIARQRHASKCELTIIGGGEQKDELARAIVEQGASEFTELKDALPYGPQLFDELYTHDVLLAAPQRQDTPRSVFDAMSNGLLTLGYDTYYYSDLGRTGAVTTVPWLDVDAMAAEIAALEGDAERCALMTRAGVKFARDNTQEAWLERREGWLRDALSTERGAASP